MLPLFSWTYIGKLRTESVRWSLSTTVTYRLCLCIVNNNESVNYYFHCYPIVAYFYLGKKSYSIRKTLVLWDSGNLVSNFIPNLRVLFLYENYVFLNRYYCKEFDSFWLKVLPPYGNGGIVGPRGQCPPPKSFFFF